MFKKIIICYFFVLAIGVILSAQTRGTPSNLRVLVDATGALVSSSVAVTNPVTAVQFNNARLALDSAGSLLVTDGSGAGFATLGANDFLAAQTISLTGLTTTSTNGLTLRNTTAATALVPVQMSPRTLFRGNAWDTAANETVDFFIENLPATAATPTGTLRFGYSLNGASAVFPLLLTSAGNGTFGSNVRVGASNAFQFSTTRSQISSSADGNLNLASAAGTSTPITNLTNGAAIVELYTTATITSGFSTTAPSIVGKANAFAVTIAATPGVTGTVAFNGTYTNIPSCSCTNTITANLVQCVPTTSVAVLNGVWLANDIIRCQTKGY